MVKQAEVVKQAELVVKPYYGLSILDIQVCINVKAKNMQISLVRQASLDNPEGFKHYWSNHQLTNGGL